MIWTFLIILWVLFLTMFLVGVLSVRQGTQVLGVRFLPEYRYAPEIKAVITLSAPFPLMSVRSMPSSSKYPSSIAAYWGA